VVDLSQGVGGDLAHYAQNNAGTSGLEPQIPLGSSGQLALDGPPLPWQVVGFLERCDIPEGDDDETTFWREYLLYHREAGFAFLVDSNEGWSWVRPLTGAPQVAGDVATWKGKGYRKRWNYGAKVTWVQGEFYWRVRRDERAQVTDYEGQGADAALRLSREQAGQEVTWSAGRTILAETVADAFGIPAANRRALQRDVAPAFNLGSSWGGGAGKVVLIIVVVLILMMLLPTCGDRCDDVRQTFGESSLEYQQCRASRSSGSSGRTSGGSYGGWSSGGGGHK